MDIYVCGACGYEYDPAAGDPDHALNREQPLRIFRMTGLARFVVWVRIPLSRKQSKVCL